MKIKKSTLDDIIIEEVHAILKEGSMEEGWDAFKRGMVRGLTKGGKDTGFVSQFVQAAALPSEAKSAIGAIDHLIERLEQMTGFPDIGDSPDKGATYAAALKLESGMNVESLNLVARGLKQDMMTLFSRLGGDAPKSDAPETPSETPEERKKRKMAQAMDDDPRVSTSDMMNEGLRKQIRKRLRQLKFTS